MGIHTALLQAPSVLSAGLFARGCLTDRALRSLAEKSTPWSVGAPVSLDNRFDRGESGILSESLLTR